MFSLAGRFVDGGPISGGSIYREGWNYKNWNLFINRDNVELAVSLCWPPRDDFT